MRASTSRESRPLARGEIAMLAVLVAAKLTAHFVANGRYGYFRDELYFLACGEHLAWGYVDQPPLVAVIARLVRATLGDSLFAIRLLPALAGAAKLALTVLLARRLGGGRTAQLLAGVAVLVAPVFLGVDDYFSMNAFDQLFWVGAAFLVVEACDGERRWPWVALGLVLGVALLNKLSIVFFGFGLAVGLLVTRERRRLAKAGPWIAAAIALAIFAPHVVWQIRHGWPTLEQLASGRAEKNLVLSPLQFLAGVTLEQHPFTVPLWIAGLVFFFSRAGQRHRVLGWIFVAAAASLVFLKGKTYYLAPAFPILFAGGGCALESFFARRGWRLASPAFAAAMIAGGVLTAPLAIPVLPVETFIRYSHALGLAPPKLERHDLGPLPQQYADMFGWEEMVAAVARVYDGLAPDERARCAIFTGNYGEAGAIDFFGPRLGLPKAISGHNQYFLWGPRGASGDVLITIGQSMDDVRKVYDDVEVGATLHHPYAMPYENRRPIYVCRKPRVPLAEAWPMTKHYD
jgi:dolichyl-phosphate-mannose-protein mannosyltransferase